MMNHTTENRRSGGGGLGNIKNAEVMWFANTGNSFPVKFY
jgi:hypothetical protein